MAKSFHTLASPPLPKRIFKLAVESESKAFVAAGKIASELDKADGFVHLSDRTSVPVVAKLFFTTAADLKLLKQNKRLMTEKGILHIFWCRPMHA